MCAADIKIFVCCHQLFEIPQHPLLVPLQVGTALAAERFPSFWHDDTGDNISEKNGSYCELTGQYWAWRNVTADYYGFFHYRRYLYPDPDVKRPYCIRRVPSLPLLERLGYHDFSQIIEHHDVLIPKGENMYLSVREHYIDAPWHFREDLELLQEIVRKQSPQMANALEQYMTGTVCYFGNIYIMRQSVFYDYCEWLFSILKEFDRRSSVSRRSTQGKRVDGYLAERLLGIYCTYFRNRLKILELPRVHFITDSMWNYQGRRAIYTLLPPGTRRRAWVKNCLKERRYAAENTARFSFSEGNANFKSSD